MAIKLEIQRLKILDSFNLARLKILNKLNLKNMEKI